MQKFSTLQDAIALAEFAHRNQLDKAGKPYIDHPKRVLASVQAQGAPIHVQIAAILHDVIEDTPITLCMLLDLGFPIDACALVDVLTYCPDSSIPYYSKIIKIEEAKIIKLADIRDNLSEERLSYLDEDVQKRLRAKYKYALIALRGME